MFSLKQYVKKKIKNQVYYYIEEHKEELANDFYHNVAIDSGRKTLSEIVIEKNKKEDEYCSRLEYLEREHGRRQWEHVWYAYSRWWTEGASPELLREFEYKERFFDFWEDGQPLYWVIYISCLLEVGQKAKAIDISKKFIRYYNSAEVYKSISVAALFDELNIVDNMDVKRSAEIRKKLYNGYVYKELERYLTKTDSIAIVGNSRREVGLGLGEEIDRHDVVIRLNGGIRNDEKKTIKDYGNKCDIWARNGAGDFLMTLEDLQFAKKPEFIIYCDDYEHGFIHTYELFQLLYEDVNSNDYITCMIPTKEHFELREKSGLINPTSGAYLIWYIYKILGNLKKVDFYGFSFVDKELKSNDFDAGSFDGQHFMDREMDFLYKLWKENC